MDDRKIVGGQDNNSKRILGHEGNERKMMAKQKIVIYTYTVYWYAIHGYIYGEIIEFLYPFPLKQKHLEA